MNSFFVKFPGKRQFAWPENFETAYEKYVDSIYGLIMKSTNGNKQQAQMLLCDTFTGLFHEIQQQPLTTEIQFMHLFTVMLHTLKTNRLIFDRISLVRVENEYLHA